MEILVAPAVHAQLLALQSSLQALVLALAKISSGPPPLQPLASQSKGRRARRQATARKMYAVKSRPDCIA